eukprot:SAG31_NODE_687_length_12813_cov_2.597216_5_plen_69_part_00
MKRVLGGWVQYHVTRRRVEQVCDNNVVLVDARLIHALVEELLPAAAVMIDGAVALVAACNRGGRKSSG